MDPRDRRKAIPFFGTNQDSAMRKFFSADQPVRQGKPDLREIVDGVWRERRVIVGEAMEEAAQSVGREWNERRRSDPRGTGKTEIRK